jgi:flagellar protein FlbD
VSSMGADLKHARWVADARCVIALHRLHGNGTIMVNADLIESLEACPDTVVTLVNKRRFVVEDRLEDVVDSIVAYRARIAAAVNDTLDHGAGARAHSILTDEEEAA